MIQTFHSAVVARKNAGGGGGSALLTNLISYWKMDEASGNAIDAHGANDLTETGGAIASTTGKILTCRDFESADSRYFTIPDNTDLSTGDIGFTMQAWVNLESAAGNYGIVGKWNFPDREYVLGYENGANRFFFGVSANGSAFSSQRYASTFGAPSLATWYLIHAWHDPVADVIGVAVNAGTADTNAYSSGVFDSAAAFGIGRTPDTYGYFDGLIDEVGFWKRVLTGSERTELYNGGAGLAYPFS